MTNEAVKEYQCPGCFIGDCVNMSEFDKDILGIGCKKQCSGTALIPGGRIILGLPKGFNHAGDQAELRPRIFLTKYDQEEAWGYDKFNLPFWKYRTNEHIFVRGYMPRVNQGFIHIILENNDEVFDKIECRALSEKDLEDMD